MTGAGVSPSLLDRWLRPGANTSRDVTVDLLWLIGLALVLMATGLGLRDPWPADEPRFALVAQDMLRSGDWMIPRVGGDLYADKPPVFFWLMAAAMALTGSLRLGFLLPSLLAGIGSVVLVYDLLVECAGERLRSPAAWCCCSRSSSCGSSARRRSTACWLLHHARACMGCCATCSPAEPGLVLRRLVRRRHRRHHQGRRFPAAAGPDSVCRARGASMADGDAAS